MSYLKTNWKKVTGTEYRCAVYYELCESAWHLSKGKYSSYKYKCELKLHQPKTDSIGPELWTLVFDDENNEIPSIKLCAPNKSIGIAKSHAMDYIKGRFDEEFKKKQLLF